MNATPNKLLQSEVWLLDCQRDALSDLLGSLDCVSLAAHSNGVMSLSKSKKLFPLLIDTQLMFPERGQAIAISPETKFYFREGSAYHKDYTLEIAPPSKPESLTISFNHTAKNEKTITAIAKLVVSSIDEKEVPPAALQYPVCCPCCREKREAIRQDIKLHPLYHIIKAVDQSQALTLSHQGAQVDSRQELKQFELLSHHGILHLRAEQQHCSVDLTHVYHVRVGQSQDQQERSIQLDAFNSFGTKILSLNHPNPESFHRWCNILEHQEVHQ